MAAEGAEIKDEQIPPQEAGGDDEVRSSNAPQQLRRDGAVFLASLGIANRNSLDRRKLPP